MKKIILALGSICLFTAHAQTFVVDTSLSLMQLVNQKLLGGAGTASNITFVGNAKSFGFFRVANKPNPWPANKDSLGMDSGLFLTSGVYDDLSGGPLPAGQSVFNGPATNFQSFSNGGGGDMDLSALSGNNTLDAAILEFDFIPLGNLITFEYVFGSEEYNDYVNSINDAFGFFINGVSTPLMKTNLALIQNTTSPVTINSVNNGSSPGGTAGMGPCVNCAYYRDNWNSKINGVYDGYTTLLTASKNLIGGQTYHIKIAIADVSDRAFDSGLFMNQFKVNNSSTVKSVETNSNFTIYKDINNKVLRIQSDEKNGSTYFKIINSVSKEVLGKNIQQGELEFDLSRLSSGIYTLVYTYQSKTYAKKLIVN